MFPSPPKRGSSPPRSCRGSASSPATDRRARSTDAARADDDVGLDPPAVRLHTGDAPSGLLDPRHFRVLVDVDTRAIRGTRKSPHNGVVPDDPARRVVQRALDRPRLVRAEVDLRAQLPN